MLKTCVQQRCKIHVCKGCLDGERSLGMPLTLTNTTARPLLSQWYEASWGSDCSQPNTITGEVRGLLGYIAIVLLVVGAIVVPLPTPFRRCVPSQRKHIVQECVLRAQIPTSVSTEE